MEIRRRIDVSGIVQGVGFRPYVYRLAKARALAGNVRNTSAGVTIELEGPDESVEKFVAELSEHAPPLAHILDVHQSELPCAGEREFSIVESGRTERARAFISPDVAVCDDCLRELFDPSNRRHLYPFINCTNCGPRFTIVRNIPYDRPYTSMAEFEMCPACQREYDDPRDRRFHAQPIACWECGPRLELLDGNGERIACEDPIAETANRLRCGQIAAIKGLGGFHLAVDATNSAAVELLRSRKHRFEKPLAVMVPHLSAAQRLCVVDSAAALALESPERPIVLLRKRQPEEIAGQVAPSHRELGLFLPYTPIHHLLFRTGHFRALVMTSGNLSEEPIAISNDEAVERLKGIADCFLVHNRDILWRCDDSVVRLARTGVRQVRRSRGYVPVPIVLGRAAPPILAVGGELKNTICLTNGREAFLSQHIGDLENLETYRFFENVIEHLERILEINPKIIACDLHPDYLSTKWALRQQGRELVRVQHHHAHIASCMAENHLDDAVIGFALDGTGFGTDGHIWGGEVLVATYADFTRAAHFDYVPMPGGAKAIEQPWRMAAAYLAHHFGREFLNLSVPFVRGRDKRQLEALLHMMERGVNCPRTSSCGRLFDAVAALTGVREEVSYEGQAAIELEMILANSLDGGDSYPFDLRRAEDGWIIETRPLFDAMVEDLKRRIASPEISARFHRGLVEVFARLAGQLRSETHLDRVCLSGGTFQNSFLLENLQARLESAGFYVFTHSEVPSGDGGLSLGQAMVASHKCL
ncbi:MAG: carbamoyltransferase HypF [Candidatus Acidiferrales bacterium]